MNFFLLTWITLAYKLVPAPADMAQRYKSVPVSHTKIFGSEEDALKYSENLQAVMDVEIQEIDIDKIAQEELEKLTKTLRQK